MDQYQNLMDMDVDVPDLTPNLYSGLRPTNSEPVPLALCLRILADVIEHYDPHRAASLPDYFPQFGVAVGNKAVLSMIGTELQRAAFDKDPFIGLNIQKCVANSKPAYSKWFYKRQHEADFMTTARRIRPAPSGYRPHDIDNLQHVENARPVPVTPTWLTSCPRLSITSTTGHTTVTGAEIGYKWAPEPGSSNPKPPRDAGCAIPKTPLPSKCAPSDQQPKTSKASKISNLEKTANMDDVWRRRLNNFRKASAARGHGPSTLHTRASGGSKEEDSKTSPSSSQPMRGSLEKGVERGKGDIYVPGSRLRTIIPKTPALKTPAPMTTPTKTSAPTLNSPSPAAKSPAQMTPSTETKTSAPAAKTPAPAPKTWTPPPHLWSPGLKMPDMETPTATLSAANKPALGTKTSTPTMAPAKPPIAKTPAPMTTAEKTRSRKSASSPAHSTDTTRNTCAGLEVPRQAPPGQRYLQYRQMLESLVASSRPESSQIFTLNPKTDGDKEGSDPLQDPAQGQPPNVTGKQGGQSTDEHDTTGSKRSRDDENDGDSADDDWYVVIKSPAWTMAE